MPDFIPGHRLSGRLRLHRRRWGPRVSDRCSAHLVLVYRRVDILPHVQLHLVCRPFILWPLVLPVPGLDDCPGRPLPYVTLNPVANILPEQATPRQVITRHSASYAGQYEVLPCAHSPGGEPHEGVYAEAQTETEPGTVTRRDALVHPPTHKHTHAARVPSYPTPHPQAAVQPRILTKRRPSPASIAALSAALYAIASHSLLFRPEMRQPTDKRRWSLKIRPAPALDKSTRISILAQEHRGSDPKVGESADGFSSVFLRRCS